MIHEIGKTSAIKRLPLWSLKWEPRIAFRFLGIFARDLGLQRTRLPALQSFRLWTGVQAGRFMARDHGSN